MALFVNVYLVFLMVYFQLQSNVAANIKRSRSTSAPISAIRDIPMFLTLTVDDAITESAYTDTAKIMNHTNRNNETIPLVYFVSNHLTDYSKLQEIYLAGCEISVHTVTHTTGASTNLSKWYHEIKTSRQLISTHADIPIHEIKGYRSPYLDKSDLTYRVLNGINPAFIYDSTIINELDSNNGLFDWPYTLDDYELAYSYAVGQGPQQSYQLWEIPMQYLYDIPTKTIANKMMDYEGNYTALLTMFKANFLHRYNTNRAPMGLYFHSLWMQTQSNVDALNDFIDWVLAMDDTWIVTNNEIIDWIQNPIPTAQYTFSNNNQLMNGKTQFKLCQYVTGQFKTVQTQCPPYLLHDFQWNNAVKIYTEINITSTNDNIIHSRIDACADDVWTIYNSETIYCTSASDVVKYNNSLYKCLWWTTNETPGVEINSVWSLQKICQQDIVSFVKGSVSPFGTVGIFENNILNIQIQPNYGYDIVNIHANENYLYELVLDPHHGGESVLTLPFDTIGKDHYEVRVSFKSSSHQSEHHDTLHLTLGYATLLSISIAVVLLFLIFVCTVFWVMKHQRMQMLEKQITEQENNLFYIQHSPMSSPKVSPPTPPIILQNSAE